MRVSHVDTIPCTGSFCALCIQEVFQDNDYPKQSVSRNKAIERSWGIKLTDLMKSQIEKIPPRSFPSHMSKAWVRASRGPANNSTSSLPSNPEVPLQTPDQSQEPNPTRKEGVVYKVNCSCSNTYIGETGRSLDARLKEQWRAVKVNNRSNGIAVHVQHMT